MYLFSRWIATPENYSALEAVRNVAALVGTTRETQTANPLFLHGPSGTGKTHLVSALAAEVVSRCPTMTVAHFSARTLGEVLWSARKAKTEPPADLNAVRDCDLLIVEDVQHFPDVAAADFGQVLDFRCA